MALRSTRMVVCGALLTAGLLAVGCQLLWPWKILLAPQGGTAGLYRFKSADELKQYLTEQYQAKSTPAIDWSNPLQLLYLLLNPDQGLQAVSQQFALTWFLGAAAAPSGATENRDSAGQYSTTNLQEAGVDEGDVMKNDADYVYVLKEGTLRIAKVQPPDALEQLSSVAIEGQPDSLYLLGDKLVALSGTGQWYWYEDAVASPAAPVAASSLQSTTQVIVTIIDVTDRSEPNIIRTYRMEGRLVDSRMVEGRLHIVLAVTPNLPQPEEMPGTPLEKILPMYEVGDGNGGASSSGLIADWPSFYRPADPDGYGIIVVATINTNDPNAEIKSAGLTADAGLIYASTQALYLTDTTYGYSWLSKENTVVHKFHLKDDGAEYAGSGSVPGRPLNQFSLGEYQDFLRIATTVGHVGPIGGDASNNVYVLGEGNAGLEVVGKVEGIAPGEQIYSARFIGPRGFLVTFVKVDPLFTLDLADPCNPKVVGQLKVPGYSNYIHILDENHLLTIGKDAEAQDENWALYQGVQLSIFDVTNFAEPNLMYHESIGTRGTYSEALDNHKAFNFFAPKALLAIPIDLYEGSTGDWSWGTHTFSGLYVYRVTVDEGFNLLGRINTSVRDASEPYWYYYGGNWTRGVFIGDNVYAVTNQLIRSAAASDPNTVIDTLVLPTTP
jgi:inhibitor of cysteine peptidase